MKSCIDCGRTIDNRRKRCEGCNELNGKTYKSVAKILMERSGYCVADVEKIHHRGRMHWREDMFGVIDLVAISEHGKTRRINTFPAKTTGSGFSEHLKKFNALPDSLKSGLLADNNTFELWGAHGPDKKHKAFLGQRYFLVWEISRYGVTKFRKYYGGTTVFIHVNEKEE